MTSNQNNKVDQLLNELKSQYKSSNNCDKSPNNIENLLNQVKSEIKNNKIATQGRKNQAPQSNSQVNQYLDTIKARYQNQQNNQKTQQDLIYQKNQQEVILKEQQKQLNYKQLIREAKQWLAQLDHNSDEGIWFNQLAESYPSQLDAAISYLSTLKQSNS